MLEWDLAALIDSDSQIAPPRDRRLNALRIALLLAGRMAFSDLRNRTIALTAKNLPQIAEIFDWHLPEFSRDIGNGGAVRDRLSELKGIRVTGIS